MPSIRPVDPRQSAGVQAQAGRSLTSGEIALARGIFGSRIDYDRVRVFNSKWKFFMPTGTPHAPNGNLYYDAQAGYMDDFSTADRDKKSVFLHEMTHVWQHQRGANLVVGVPMQSPLKGSGAYVYKHIFTDAWKMFARTGYQTMQPGGGTKHIYYLLKYEAQAEFISDYYRISNGGRAAIAANGGIAAVEYERLMPPELRVRSGPRAVPVS